MANTHFGNLADVFKHLALAEVLGCLHPAEYWESHAGSAWYDETPDPPPERLHGVHAFRRLLTRDPVLASSCYGKILAQFAHADALPRIPGSPLIARHLLADNVRRMLFCDTDAASLRSIRQHLPSDAAAQKEILPDTIECVQDDGVSILRGACMFLPEPWTASTLAFLDPYHIHTPTDADISPLDLACELASRNIHTMLFYTFPDDARRAMQHERISQRLEKARLLMHGGHHFEGALKTPPGTDLPTTWGFGLLTFHLNAETLTAMDAKLHALASAYENTNLVTPEGTLPGAWRYSRAAI